MISSPAGSGKTEKLARRYIALLRGGAPVERILAITFTDKAAAEMKERILAILRDEQKDLYETVREKMPVMRISTIHSFCLKLLKRFWMDMGRDPSPAVMDSFQADMLWNEAIYEALLEDGTSGDRLFYEFMKDRGVKGWNKLYALLHELHGKRPHIEFGLRNLEMCEPARSQDHVRRLVSLYECCLDRYRRKKTAQHLLDFNDLEIYAYEALTLHPEWQNILYVFDEHTDHLLVDEFQDTSTLQWKIIDRLTEEWRSGLGPKRESGTVPTIFLVGDAKQSIYSFRGANVSLFRHMREKLARWLGDEYHYVEVTENYRSLPAIVAFVNTLFSRIMPAGMFHDESVEYTPFSAFRPGEGRVDVMLLGGPGAMRENRKAEAAVLARKIRSLAGALSIQDGEGERICGFGDMAILLRNRTHLSVVEDALRSEDVPFIVVKGIGFYSTPEIGIVRSVLFFLIDPFDDYSLFYLLRSPLFSVTYADLDALIRGGLTDDGAAQSLYERLCALVDGDNPAAGSLVHAKSTVAAWLERKGGVPYAVLLEEILAETGAYGAFNERQRHVNVRKFIRIVEGYESRGFSGLEIREKLIRAAGQSDEAKANVSTEHLQAVRIMTVHAAKGLQFPLVFLPFLDEKGGSRTERVVLDEEGDRVVLALEEDSAIRRRIPLFQREGEKAKAEEKRLFYVAVTRAMDYLCLSGIWKDPPTGRLADLDEAFSLSTPDPAGDMTALLQIERLSDGDVRRILDEGGPAPAGQAPVSVEPMVPGEPVFLDPLPSAADELWLDVTEEVEDIRAKHGDDWVVLGRAFHRIFELLSKGLLVPDSIGDAVVRILRNELVSDERIGHLRDIIMSDMDRLAAGRHLGDIILPAEGSFAELPFILRQQRRVYKGRIDRIILRDGIAHVYDYKTYPIVEREIPSLIDRYAFQMALYGKASEELFGVNARTYLFFTHVPLIVPVGRA